MQIENFDVSPFCRGYRAFSAVCRLRPQTLRRALKAVPQGNGNPVRRWDYQKPLLSSASVMPQMWPRAAELSQPVAGAAEGYRTGEPH